MMIHAYSELYLDDAMDNLGSMMEYAVCDCGYDCEQFWEQFINSGIANMFGKGNPKYVAGLSGVEIALEVIGKTQGVKDFIKPSYIEYKGREYWSGWIMAYYQWFKNSRFEDMKKNGLDMTQVMSMYVLHEADPSKFVEEADKIIEKNRQNKITNLQKIRKARGMTQKQLSENSGVSLRMIQLYEQGQNDIRKAQAEVVIQLAKVLGCDIESLIN